MDYFDILKKAWDVAWRQKRLWWFGVINCALMIPLYAVCVLPAILIPLGEEANWLDGTAFGDQLPLFVGLAAGAFLVSVAAWLAMYAVQAALLVGTNEAAAGRAVDLTECWHAGLRRWGRVLMTNLGAMLPGLLVMLVVGGVFIGVMSALPSDSEALGAIVAASVIVLGVLYLLAYALMLLAGILYQVALCYGVLQDVTFGQALKRAWDDLWGKKGVFVFYLVMLLPSFALSTVLSVVMMVIQIPLTLLIALGGVAGIVVFLVIMVLAMFVPMPLYVTFYQACWTIFFRRMTGMDPLATRAGEPALAAPIEPMSPAPAGPVAAALAEPVSADA